MAFHHLAGVTTPGAPDEIVDWFATFEAWICDVVGWIRVAGAGTTNLRIRSVGELGGLTMLFAHIWRGAGPNIDRVYFEVSDDAIPTHETTNDGYVDSGGVQFNYWMSADLDAMSVVWKIGAGYRWKYAGLTYPFALTVPDETYQSISADRIAGASAILRNQAGLWDQNANLTDNALLDDTIPDRFDGSLALIGVYHNTGVNIGGQLKHVSGEIDPANAVNPEDTVDTGFAPNTCQWIVLTDSIGLKFAMRTGGALPTGFPDGAHFAHQTGVAVSPADLMTNIAVPFLVARGWIDRGDPGFPNCDFSRILESPGESGTEQIFIGWGHQPILNPGLYGHVQDDLAGTHWIRNDRINMVVGDFPTNYWITADRDCFIVTFQRGVTYDRIWMGMVQAFAPGLYAAGNTPYKVVLMTRVGPVFGTRLLRDHDGAWGGPGVGFPCAYLLAESASNPNAYDGVTYHVWPGIITRGVVGGNEPIGIMRYQFGTQGGGVANLDTITVGAQIFTVFFDSAPNEWAMRTA